MQKGLIFPERQACEEGNWNQRQQTQVAMDCFAEVTIPTPPSPNYPFLFAPRLKRDWAKDVPGMRVGWREGGLQGEEAVG